MVEVEFGDFNPEPDGDPDDQIQHGPFELLQKQDQGDFLRSVAEAVLQMIMEADVEGVIGAGRHERAEHRTTWRNGYRYRALDTRLGTLNLKVPKLRQGSYFPGFLEGRRICRRKDRR